MASRPGAHRWRLPLKRGTPDHPKTKDLARRLKIPLWGAVGILELLWHFAAKFAPQGNIGKYPPKAIAEACHWRRSPEGLLAALRGSRWCDHDATHGLLLHDWVDHCDQAVKKFLQRNKLEILCPDMDILPLPEPKPLPEPQPRTDAFPEATAWLKEGWQAGDKLILRIVEAAQKVMPEITDGQLANVLSRARKREQHSPGLFLQTVPDLIRLEVQRWHAANGTRMPPGREDVA